LDDLGQIAEYIAADNPVAAKRLALRVREVGRRLADMATGRPGRVTGTYEKPVPRLPYILVYALVSNDGHEAISIVRVIHAARDWPDEQWPE